MRQKLNSSIYKIMEGEIGNYVGGKTQKIEVEIECTYEGTQSKKLSSSKLGSLLESNSVDLSKLNMTKTISSEPRVPYLVNVKLSTYVSNPDLDERTFDMPGPTDIYREKTYDKTNYVDGIGWDATDSEKRPTVSKSIWQDFDPIRLKKAGVRTYNFHQQAKP